MKSIRSLLFGLCAVLVTSFLGSMPAAAAPTEHPLEFTKIHQTLSAEKAFPTQAMAVDEAVVLMAWGRFPSDVAEGRYRRLPITGKTRLLKSSVSVIDISPHQRC